MPLGSIYFVDLRRLHQLDVHVIKPLRRVQLSVGALGVSAQELFAQRRPSVGQGRIIGQDADRVMRIVLTESFGCAQARRTATHDDQPCRIHAHPVTPTAAGLRDAFRFEDCPLGSVMADQAVRFGTMGGIGSVRCAASYLRRRRPVVGNWPPRWARFPPRAAPRRICRSPAWTLRAQDVRPGDLFAALPGATTHGARFFPEAVERGAIAVLTDADGLAQLNRDAGSAAVLVHPDPRSVLGDVAATVYERPSEHLTVVGVTGTSGKTTTTYLIEAGLRAAGRTVGLIGTVGLRIDGEDIASALTTPEAPALQALLAAMAERGVDTVVMEVSSHALTLGRVDGIQFAVGAFTNLSRDHLDFHLTMEDYFEAKARLFDPASLLHARRAVVCVDDDAGRAMAHRAAAAVTVSTKGRPADWRAEAGTAQAGVQEFTAVDPAGVHHRMGIALPGDYNVANCLVALAVLDAVGVSPEQASAGLRHTQVPGRLEQINRGQDFLALVDYAHKPGALHEVLRTLRRPAGRLAVVIRCRR